MKVELIILQSVEEYKSAYEEHFVNCEIFLGEIPILFDIKSFDHIFYEPGKLGSEYRFSTRRAKRMLFIKQILSQAVEIEIMHEADRGTFAIFCLDLECVVYLRARPGTGGLQIGSFFDFGENHTKMYHKQKKKCEPITLQEIRKML